MKTKLNLNDDWTLNEEAYEDWIAKITELGEEIGGIDSIISGLYEDIAMWEERKLELTLKRSNLTVEDFI